MDGWKLSLGHLYIWGYPTEAQLYNSQQKKIDPKIVSCYFIGYPKRSKDFRFYCPSHTTRVIETGTARFIEDSENSESGESYYAVLQKIRKPLLITVTPRDIPHKPVQYKIMKY